MEKKLMNFKTKGMNKDLSVSAFNPEFSFDNRNLRLSTNEGNTLMSWVNEKGTKPITFVEGDWKEEGDEKATLTSIEGTPVGTAVINNQLVLFTHSNTADHIYCIKYHNKEEGWVKGIELFHGDLGFSTEHPLETLTSYESESIQKVYWVDGVHQPRMINIVKDPSSYYDEDGNPISSTLFDFVRELKLDETIKVTKLNGGLGEFPAGVIQYAFTYYTINGQESNIFYTTPLQYITYRERGGSPEDKITVNFKIEVEDFDKTFDFIRIYSILRTSLNAVPVVKRIQDIDIRGTQTDKVSYIDTNLSGDTVDPTHLLYLSGESIIAKTIEQKDNTLFLGNISTPHSSLDKSIKDAILDTNGIDRNSQVYLADNVVSTLEERKFTIVPTTGTSGGGLAYIYTLSCPEDIEYQGAAAFKNHEYYRLGIQFQDTTGRWSEPCWIGDKQVTINETLGGTAYYGPDSDDSGEGGVGKTNVPIFKYTIPHNNTPKEDIQTRLYKAGYRRMRALYAQPRTDGRTILCQGVVCPTMFRQKDRTEGFAYAQSSWLFRAAIDAGKYHGFLDYTQNGNAGAVMPIGKLPSTFYWHYVQGDKEPDRHSGVTSDSEYWNNIIVEWDPYVGQWDNPTDTSTNPPTGNTNRIWMPYYRSTEVMGVFDGDTTYQIDPTFCTIHSADVEFSDTVSNSDLSSAKIRRTGYSELTSTFGDINITTSSDSIKPGKGFRRSMIRTIGTSALISGNFYEDHIVLKKDNEYRPMFKGAERTYRWLVCMWHRDGSLNNDVVRENQSAKLKTKVISNYRFSEDTTYFQTGNASMYDLPHNGIGYYGYTEADQLIKVNNNIYKGCIDIVVYPTDYGSYYPVGLQTKDNGTGDTVWGIDGDITRISNIAAWDPELTDLPLLKIHTDDRGNPSTNKWVWLIQWDDGSTDWASKKNMPDYDDDWEGRTPGYRWNTLGGEYEDLGDEEIGLVYHKTSVPIKYKSTPHLAVQLNTSSTDKPNEGIYNYIGSTEALSVVEIYKDYDKNTFFGGASDEALQEIVWIPCGPVVNIDTTKPTVVPYKWGDTYFQRYECLKTYPYTFEDKNQVVEIGSFMLETRVNIDGRYDRNRAKESNLNVSPQNFNLINPVYSQLDNFFNYKILSQEAYKNTEYANQITWTLTKESGADVDAWTNVTLANTLDLDGECGQINKLIRFNDQLIVFQDTGISQIIYNGQQLATTEGVPVEIANSGKVTGKRYFSNTIGCSNKWSMTTTPNGIYFMDSYGKSIYLFNGEITSLSDKYGFNSWCKKEIPSATVKWCPSYIEDNEEKGFDNFVTYYDKINQDVLFINNDEALAFSEKIGNFTSFYDYGNVPYFCNLEDTGVWITNTGELWMHQAGEYCKFFDENKPYSITLVGNPEPQTDKIFTNLEFRASVEGDGEYIENTGKFIPTLPFNSIEVWNDYQHGEATLNNKSGYDLFKHHTGNDTLKRKFRIWRCDIPRDDKRPMDRMRNPWIYLKLKKNMAEEDSLPKAEIHDLVMTYYN